VQGDGLLVEPPRWLLGVLDRHGLSLGGFKVMVGWRTLGERAGVGAIPGWLPGHGMAVEELVVELASRRDLAGVVPVAAAEDVGGPGVPAATTSWRSG
jgi:hypothetical protein